MATNARKRGIGNEKAGMNVLLTDVCPLGPLPFAWRMGLTMLNERGRPAYNRATFFQAGFTKGNLEHDIRTDPPMRKTNITNILIAVLVATCFCASAQDQKAILQKLESQYSLTKPTADKTDIVTAGSILVLQKDNLLMVPTTSSSPCQNTYKDGRITQAGLSKITSFGRGLSKLSQSASGTRTFVAGEKMWVTRIDARDNGATFELFPDAYGEVRYKATLLFPFAKGPLPPADQVDKIVHEMFKVQPAEESKGNGQQAPAGGAQAPPAGAQAG